MWETIFVCRFFHALSHEKKIHHNNDEVYSNFMRFATYAVGTAPSSRLLVYLKVFGTGSCRFTRGHRTHLLS